MQPALVVSEYLQQPATSSKSRRVAAAAAVAVAATVAAAWATAFTISLLVLPFLL